jgi:spore coat polysaccharide biosynthesis predicted glycosyltransferase SpsG
MIKKIQVYTEGSPEIGLGHLVECISIIEILEEQYGLDESFFIVNGDEKAEDFLRSKGIKFCMVENGVISPGDVIKQYDAVLVNKKHVKYEFLKALSGFARKLIVIDELGKKKITADILVNFSINKKLHKYEFPDFKPITLFGPEYFPASRAVHEALELPKRKKNQTIIVSLGGYDRSRTVDKVLIALEKYNDLKKQVVLGPGFHQDVPFKDLVNSLDGTFEFHNSVSDLPKRIKNASFLVSSGGNTVYESVLVGTPVLVIGEDPHEIEQGKIFEDNGWAINVNKGKKANIKEISDAIDKMKSKKFSSDKAFSLRAWHKLMV